MIEGLRETMQETLAEALGVTVEELEAAKAERTPLNDLAAEQGVDLAEVQAAMDAAHQEAVEQALADGTITQAQADRMLKRLEQSDGLKGFGPRRGGRRGSGNDVPNNDGGVNFQPFGAPQGGEA